MASTVYYCKLFEVEKFHGCKTKLKFAGKHSWLDGSLIWPKPITLAILLENFAVTNRFTKM